MSDLRSAVEALRRAVVMDWGPTVESAVAIIDAHQCLPFEGAVPTDVVHISSQCLPSEEDLAAALHEASVSCMRQAALPRDVCRPDKRAGAYHRDEAAAILASLRERRG